MIFNTSVSYPLNKQEVSGYLGNVNSSCFGKSRAQLLNLQEQKGGCDREEQTLGYARTQLLTLTSGFLQLLKEKIDGRRENPNRYIKHCGPETFKQLCGKAGNGKVSQAEVKYSERN